MHSEKIKAEFKSKAILIAIPAIIAAAAGGMFPSLIGVTDSFSFIGALVWASIIALLDFKMIDLNNPNFGVKSFRFMLLCLTATITSVIIDNYIFAPDIDQWKLSNPPADNKVAIQKAQKDYDVAIARYDCEKSGKRDCGYVQGVNITGTGSRGCGKHCNYLQEVASDAKATLDAVKSQSQGGLLYDFKALKGVIKEDSTALVFWVFFFVLMIALEGIVLFLMHTESKMTNAKVIEIDDKHDKINTKTKNQIEYEIMIANEKMNHEKNNTNT